MSKATDTEIKDLISGIDRKVDLLAQEVSSIKSTVEKLDNRLWVFGGLILAACLGAFLKALNL
jgi:archaellum component FlaC